MAVAEDQTLDVRGQMCPMPIVRAAQAMRAMSPGAVLKILATDRGSVADVPAWAGDGGHELLSATEEDGVFVYLVRRGEPS